VTARPAFADDAAEVLAGRVTPSPARLARGEAVVLVAGPALLVAGWIVLIAGAGQGAGDGWLVGHYLLFVANAAWLPIALLLGRLSGDSTLSIRQPALWLVVLGSLAIAGQLAIDMTAWALGLGQDELRTFFATLRDRPPLTLTVHTIGPSLLFLGLFVSASRIARSRPAARRAAMIVAAGILVVFGGALLTFSYVILGGYVAVTAGFAALAWAFVERPSAAA
jgi:hypothetical protein